MIKAWLAAAVGAAIAFGAGAAEPQQDERFDTGAGNLLVVLRTLPGADQKEDRLRPLGMWRARLSDGRLVDMETSWFTYLGDLQVRLVFEGAQQLQSASPDDLRRLGLDDEQAVGHALANLRARHGAPQASPWSGGLMQVHGRSDDLNSSYLLDRDFWLARLQEHPEGVVAAVPMRGGLVYAPLADDTAMTNLKFGAAALYASNDRSRVSSGLYLFKDGRWSVYQSPQPLP